MANKLLTQKDVLKKLTKAGLVTFKKSAFIEAVQRGQIPYEYVEGSKGKRYNYTLVAESISQAGIGKPISKANDLDSLPDPKSGQSSTEYGEEIMALGEKPTLTDANIYKTLYTGKLEKLKYEQMVGGLISRDEVEDKAFSVARVIRNKLLTIPERLSNELASISDAHQIKELLFKEFNILLDDLSKDTFV